ncbi:hypothetical protein K493DRAFT_333276 [Basidiobolus meristosporus CBS 931.73]|uniref:CMP/dCMP-type deaminase domain-containing protein n=1 Tax=Basidiobolus meristosporus CBS 931.73 TaxID=1314790 RepID=A0A1Y1Z7I6_9FUNG|nr:hypothetical protein K493DRAFT_333276 [Basidiobolus meristosporus CBS 931.73]|eukprot:ORY06074.1 hypothetical protein K493DRAFT_333276 [Basidiobolus meristosporus CBS 931.73]
MRFYFRAGFTLATTFLFLVGAVNSVHIGQPDEDDFEYMQRTIDYTLSVGKCLEQPFGASIVRKKTGEVLCYGVNTVSQSPTWHGETKAIENCAAIYPDQGNNATFWKELTLYTTGSRIGRLVISSPMEIFSKTGFTHIPLKYSEIAKQLNSDYFTDLEVVEGVLAEVTNPWFEWQYKEDGKCPPGCYREGSKCVEAPSTMIPETDDNQPPADIKQEL